MKPESRAACDGLGFQGARRVACRDNGKENGNYYSRLGLYRDNGKENGNHCSRLGLYRDNGKANGPRVCMLILKNDVFVNIRYAV